MHLRPFDYLVVVACSLVPFILLAESPVFLGCPIVIVPSDLEQSFILGVDSEHGILLQRLNTSIFVPT